MLWVMYVSNFRHYTHKCSLKLFWSKNACGSITGKHILRFVQALNLMKGITLLST